MKKTGITTLLMVGLLMLLPGVVSAQCAGRNNFCEMLLDLGDIVNLLIGIVSSLALLVFIWGIVKYIASAGDEDAKEEGRRIMVGGVIALFVMFSVFGLIRFLRTSFGINNSSAISAPGTNL
ncbi:MAG: hypothetical protein KBD16_01210 [Candidatus Pacebacteria bacterium]|nr:hypothetical protein [Candidatus Paceibacterota bacterium]